MVSKDKNISCCKSCNSSCCSCEGEKEGKNKYLQIALSLFLLVAGLVLDHYYLKYHPLLRFVGYFFAYLPVAFPVLKKSFSEILRKNVFNEFTLMSIATVGAFFIGQYPEGVAVMVFYTIGEMFQDSALDRAQSSIRALLDIRPKRASVYRNGKLYETEPEEVNVGDIIQVKPGEKVPLDGVLLSERSSFDTSALTGESKPSTIRRNERVMAGMVNKESPVELKVEKRFEDSSIAKILDMVENATSRKSKTELLISRFAQIYTPAVFILAVLIVFIPYFFVRDYLFDIWLYRALVFLVISCPCALVISIPLGYFGGLGAASKQGILFKGANFMDVISKMNTLVMDKTGTMTKGVFEVKKIESPLYGENDFLKLVASVESFSNHPVAKAINSYYHGDYDLSVEGVKEIPGCGLEANVEGKKMFAGNSALMKKNGIAYDPSLDESPDTNVIVAIGGVYCGYISISDTEKEDAGEAVRGFLKNGIKNLVMLSGDKPGIVRNLAIRLGIGDYHGGLLPEDKVSYVEKLKKNKNNIVGFIGDGINDAPSLALSDVGIAMGSLGSDAAIEIADVVIQTDQPSRINTAIRIGRSTRFIVKQNIVLALSVKGIVLVLGAAGFVSMWAAVFADVGVALIAILNAVRILKMKF